MQPGGEDDCLSFFLGIVVKRPSNCHSEPRVNGHFGQATCSRAI